MGENGAGHYVKMVHNGIEYGDMQLICEAYNLMKTGLGMTADEMHQVFAEWHQGELNSYLIEITRDILAFKDTDGQPLVDKILDTAGQKGTGKWTVISSQELGIPITLIAEAVYARCISALKDERVAAAQEARGPAPGHQRRPREEFIEDIRKALYASKIVSYAQGYMLMRAAAEQYNWNLNYGGIALMWRGGCIIRSVFLGKIKEAFDKNPKLHQPDAGSLLPQGPRTARTGPGATSWPPPSKKGIPVPAFSTALAFYDGYRSERLPANLLQAQRDYFGAHTYERAGPAARPVLPHQLDRQRRRRPLRAPTPFSRRSVVPVTPYLAGDILRPVPVFHAEGVSRVEPEEAGGFFAEAGFPEPADAQLQPGNLCPGDGVAAFWVDRRQRLQEPVVPRHNAGPGIAASREFLQQGRSHSWQVDRQNDDQVRFRRK